MNRRLDECSRPIVFHERKPARFCVCWPKLLMADDEWRRLGSFARSLGCCRLLFQLLQMMAATRCAQHTFATLEAFMIYDDMLLAYSLRDRRSTALPQASAIFSHTTLLTISTRARASQTSPPPDSSLEGVCSGDEFRHVASNTRQRRRWRLLPPPRTR